MTEHEQEKLRQTRLNIKRKPLDPASVDCPEYVRGHATGRALPAETAPRG